jgi:histidyl-tRNA synthetase
MSDHIPDATKMIGETPRTDQQNDNLLNSDSYTSWLEMSGFARQLERELNAVSKERDEAVFVTEKVLKEFSEHSRSLCKAIDELNADNSKIELLMSANADVARIADERDAAENRIRLLIAERDTARRQADQTYKLRKEFAELLGTDDVEQGVAVVREMKERIKRLEQLGDALAYAIEESCDPTFANDVTRWRKNREAME